MLLCGSEFFIINCANASNACAHIGVAADVLDNSAIYGLGLFEESATYTEFTAFCRRYADGKYIGNLVLSSFL